MEVRASTRNIGISAKKLRLLADAVRGRRVEEALQTLRYLPSPSARPLAKVIQAAAANAENNYQLPGEGLRLVKLWVDEGPTLKRIRAKARGRAGPILKRSCRITAVVSEEDEGGA
ncbi:MAG: 50S ribosomal protein L22 [Chloroflexi bacterium]|nr:50S ribosomal protein L22 [Chloroflexota bacterium]